MDGISLSATMHSSNKFIDFSGSLVLFSERPVTIQFVGFPLDPLSFKERKKGSSSTNKAMPKKWAYFTLTDWAGSPFISLCFVICIWVRDVFRIAQGAAQVCQLSLAKTEKKNPKWGGMLYFVFLNDFTVDGGTQ